MAWNYNRGTVLVVCTYYCGQINRISFEIQSAPSSASGSVLMLGTTEPILEGVVKGVGRLEGLRDFLVSFLNHDIFWRDRCKVKFRKVQRVYPDDVQ